MGYIPIIFFSLAGIFLWVMVNVNSLKKLKADIEEYKVKIRSATNLISSKAIDLKREVGQDNTDLSRETSRKCDKIIDLASEEVKENTTFSNLEKIKELVEQLSMAIPEGIEGNALIQSIKDVLSVRKGMLDELNDTIFNFNNNVSKPPSSYVSGLLGLRPYSD